MPMKVLKVPALILASISALTTVSALKFLPLELLDNITGYWSDEESEFKDLKGNTLLGSPSSGFEQTDRSEKKASEKHQFKSGASAQKGYGFGGDLESLFPGFTGEIVQKGVSEKCTY